MSANALQTIRILWGAIAATPLMFLVVLFTVRRPDDAAPSPVMALVFGVVALGMGYASVVFESAGLKNAAKKASVKLETEVAGAETRFRDAAPRRQVIVSPPDRVLASMLPRYNTPFILGIALGEGIVIFGFVLAFLGHGPPFWVPFFVAGWLLVLARVPRPRRFLAAVEKAQGARFRDSRAVQD